MYFRISRAFGVLLLGLSLGCATDNVAGSAAVSAGAPHGHDHAASSTDSLHTNHTNHGQGKFVLETDAPASFDERPAVGTHFTCPVSGGEFEIEPHTRVSLYEGRHYAFCCGGCAQDFDADPAFYANRLNEALSRQ